MKFEIKIHNKKPFFFVLFCIDENKGAYRYLDSTILRLHISNISSLHDCMFIFCGCTAHFVSNHERGFSHDLYLYVDGKTANEARYDQDNEKKSQYFVMFIFPDFV